ncbi:hypothetical protein OsI_34798 [Oryza sativa Indica Group]|uniref:NADH dehydrogenase [ubiquinone] 1 alpha subcomplex subunit 12 n=1 Tax=Oryza sativa subsp. indica TaxID=39946 RepID=B8BIF4_ORYSI|nr:hypothetical protein OsI_34798 [Oryza sativa Indica Group]
MAAVVRGVLNGIREKGLSNFLRHARDEGYFKCLLDGNLLQTKIHNIGATLVGVDKFGNKYYEKLHDTQYGRHRWVEYAEKGRYNASQRAEGIQLQHGDCESESTAPLLLAPHESYRLSAAILPFLFPALGGLLYGYDIGATSGATISLKEAMEKDNLERTSEPNLNLKSYLQNAYLHPIFHMFEQQQQQEQEQQREEKVEVRIDKAQQHHHRQVEEEEEESKSSQATTHYYHHHHEQTTTTTHHHYHQHEHMSHYHMGPSDTADSPSPPHFVYHYGVDP